MPTDTIVEAAEQALDRLSTHMDAKFADFERRFEDKTAKANRPASRSIRAMPDAKNSPELKAFREYLRTGRHADEKALAGSTNSGADGGYAIPKAIDSMIEQLVVSMSPIRQIANVVQVGTGDFHKLVDLRGTASGWVAETAARPATTTAQFADIAIRPAELYANPQITQVLLDDAFFDASQWLVDSVAAEFARAEGAAFISGDGSNKPLGFLTGTPVTTADGSRAQGTLMYLPTGVSGAFPASNPPTSCTRCCTA
jgi:HK97 family phage major capsid protein